MRRSVLALAGSMLILVAAASPAVAERPTLAGIEDEVMCTVCGVPLSMAREAPAAKRERALIEELIASGKSQSQIKDELVATYGDAVLAVPPKRGFNLIAWLVPLIAVIAGVAVLVLVLLAWRRRPASVSDGGPQASLSAEDSARVDAALSDRD